MRKIATLLICFIVFTAAKAQYVNIPDINFRSFLIAKYPACFNSSGQMDTTCASIVNEPILDCQNKGIANLDGVQYFKSLRSLYCLSNYLTTLPNLPDSLTDLDCSINNQIASLPNLPSSLKTLICSVNQITNLPNLPNSITYLNCGTNLLTNLPALPSSLMYLTCEYNQISNIPALPSTLIILRCSFNPITSLVTLPQNIDILDCSYNQLVSLPALPNSLTYLNCSYNQITSLPILPNSLGHFECINNQIINLPTLPNSLQHLICGNNQLTNLPTLPSSLTSLSCVANQITNLPSLPISLEYFDCGYNQLTSLPILPNSLVQIGCVNNQLTNLPTLPSSLTDLYCQNNKISCFPQLPKTLKMLNFANNKISCIPNTIALNATINPQLPLCNATNNPNGCISFPVIQGNVYADTNTNSKWDNGELARERIKISLSNGTSTFTQKKGFYEISADSLGAYTLSIHQPNLYNAQPTSITYNFSKYDTLVTDTFALQPTTIKDSLSIVATPITWAARPGFSYPYLISSENVGTTISNPIVHFIWDSSKLVLDSTSNTTAINVGNNLSWSISNFVPGQIDNVVAYFRVKTTTLIGDSINHIAVISDGIDSATDSGRAIVRGSYDPNEKQATPVLTPAQCALGKYIDYTIYFQNTGTDTAFTVVIADTLNSNLIDSSLQVVNSSHNCKTTQNGNKVFFEFKNVLLPDSNVNEKKSHGFVSFKVKPKPTLVNGNTVENKASIYFDYNTPIVTNTAITQINTSGVVLPVKMNNYDVRKLNENQVLNYWATATETNALLFNVQRSEDARTFKTFGKVLAKGNNTHYEFTDQLSNSNLPSTVYYRLQIIDKDGSISYSIIQQIRLNELTNKPISIYPNPAKDFVTIECKDGIKQLIVFDCLGKTVLQSTVNRPQLTVNTKQLKKGVYTVQVTTSKGEVKSEKLVVE